MPKAWVPAMKPGAENDSLKLAVWKPRDQAMTPELHQMHLREKLVSQIEAETLPQAVKQAKMMVPQPEFLFSNDPGELADSLMAQYTMEYALNQIDWAASPQRIPPWEGKASLEEQTLMEVLELLSLPIE